MMKKLIFTALVGVTVTAFSQDQSKEELAYSIAVEAIELMDQGEYDKSIEMLKEAEDLDPQKYIYPYEQALAFHYKEEN